VAPEPALAVPEAGLGPGDSGEVVQALERRLDALRYDVGAVDDVFDTDTVQGVTAFQKVNDLPRTGRATPDVAARLTTAQPPAAIVAGGGPSRVEVDLPHQVLFLYQGGNLDKILSISTGSGEDYCSTDGCATAVTPPGSYQVDYNVVGWDSGPLGDLYNPVYFDPKNGLAIHGSEDVPADPGSHGCVRISMAAAEWFPAKAPKGTPVYISDGQTALQPV
jgi:peptidoglycan hydrolase-like protein with peptidoglycan-binding domain